MSNSFKRFMMLFGLDRVVNGCRSLRAMIHLVLLVLPLWTFAEVEDANHGGIGGTGAQEDEEIIGGIGGTGVREMERPELLERPESLDDARDVFDSINGDASDELTDPAIDERPEPQP